MTRPTAETEIETAYSDSPPAANERTEPDRDTLLSLFLDELPFLVVAVCALVAIIEIFRDR